MKKYLFSIMFTAALISIPAFAYAKDPVVVGQSAAVCPNVQPNSIESKISPLFPIKFCDSSQLLVGIISLLLEISGLVAVLFIVIGGFKYIIAAKEGKGEKEVQVAKETITNAVIGLVIIIMGYTIVTIVTKTLETASNNNATQNPVTQPAQKPVDTPTDQSKPPVQLKQPDPTATPGQ